MEELLKLRQEIDKIDQQLVRLISSRLTAVRKIGEIKKQINKPVRDRLREKEKIEVLSVIGVKMGLDKKDIKKIWRTFFQIAYKIEE